METVVSDATLPPKCALCHSPPYGIQGTQQHNLSPVSAWETQLQKDADKDFLLDDLRHGFKIVTSVETPLAAALKNYAYTLAQMQAVEAAISKELEEERYRIVPESPTIVH